MENWPTADASASQSNEHLPLPVSRATTVVNGCDSRDPSIATTIVSGRRFVRLSNSKTCIDGWSSRSASRSSARTTHRLRISEFYCGIVALIAGICQQILCWGMIMTFGTILSYYSKHLMPGKSKTELAVIGSIPPFCLLFFALLWGRLLDAGHHRRLNLLAGILVTSGFISMMFTAGEGRRGDGRYWAILLAAVPTGIGQSIYFLAAPHTAKTWFPRHKGLAMGITNSGAAIGGAIFPIAFTEMTERYSFRGAIGLLIGVSAVLSVFIWWVGVTAPTFSRRPIGKISSFHTWWPRNAFRSWTYCIHVAAMCCIYLGILTIPFYIELWAQSNHLSPGEDLANGTGINHRSGWLSVDLVVVLNACQLPGRCLGSTLCDYVHARKAHFSASIIIATWTLPMWLLSSCAPSAIAFACIFGFLLGIMVSLPVNDAQEILGNSRIHLFGQYSGVVYMCASPFIFSGSIIAGALVDHVGHYEAGIFATVMFYVGAALILLSIVVPNDTYKFDEPSPASAGEKSRQTTTDVEVPSTSQAVDFITRHPGVVD